MKIGIDRVNQELRIGVEIAFTPEELVLAHPTLQEMVDRGASCREEAIKRVLVAVAELAMAGRAMSVAPRRPLDEAAVGCPGIAAAALPLAAPKPAAKRRAPHKRPLRIAK